jgi:hypothetical protein
MKTGARGFSFTLPGSNRLEAVDFAASCARQLAFEFGPQSQAQSSGNPQRGAPGVPTPSTAPQLPMFLGAHGRAPAAAFELDRPTVTGFSGQILIGPTCPVESTEHPCPPKPANGTVRVERAASSKSTPAGEVVATVPSDSSGHFAVSLPPGRYLLIVVKDTTRFPVPKPSVADVQAGVVTHVTLLLDTGIR